MNLNRDQHGVIHYDFGHDLHTHAGILAGKFTGSAGEGIGERDEIFIFSVFYFLSS